MCIRDRDPTANAAARKAEADRRRQTLSVERNKTDIAKTVVETNPEMNDFYNTYDRYAVTEADKKRYQQFLDGLSDDERRLLESGRNFYTLTLRNKGGLVMPVIVRAQYEDGTSEVFRYPAEIWRMNDKEIRKIIPTNKKVVQWTLDPFMEIADVDTENNSYPRQAAQPTRFQMFQRQQNARPQQSNPMQQQRQQNSGAIQGGRN